MEGDLVGVCTGVDIEDLEDVDESIASTDGKGITDIIGNIVESEDSLINTLAKKYGIDISPFRMIPMEDREPLGPWQDPVGLWRAAHGLYQAFDKEKENLLGKKLFYKEITIDDLDYYKSSLDDIIKFCKIAHEKSKRVRFIFF